MKIVITYGTFDLFHVGHVNLLKRARVMDDRLIVGISTDDLNREKAVESCIYVDEVIAETSWEQKKRDIHEYDVALSVMGDDWEGKFDDLKEDCEVFYLPLTQGISSSDLRHPAKLVGDMNRSLS